MNNGYNFSHFCSCFTRTTTTDRLLVFSRLVEPRIQTIFKGTKTNSRFTIIHEGLIKQFRNNLFT